MSQTIAAICTASGRGSIGIIRISGDDALAVASKVFVPKSEKKKIEYLKVN